MPITTDFDIFISRCVKNGAVIPEKPTLCDDILELIGNRVAQIRDVPIKAKKEHNRHFRFVMEDIKKISSSFGEWLDFCICEKCRFRTDTKYCECCQKEFCEDCEYMVEPEDCMYYCGDCYDQYYDEDDVRWR